MTNYFFKNPMRFELNGVDVTQVLSLSVDNIGKESETFSVLDTNHDIEAEFYTMANGTMEMKAKHRLYANDPSSLMDVLGFSLGHVEYDTTNDVITLVDDDLTSYDSDESSTGRIVEIRQTEATASHAISDSGVADEAWAQSFIAAGEEIYKIAVKVYASAGTPSEQFDIEIWTDDGGSPNKPNAKLASSNTVTVYATSGSDSATSYYLGHAFSTGSSYVDADWETIDFSGVTDLTGSATLTVGTVYWLVFRNVGATANDDLFFAYTTNDGNENGKALQDDDIENSPAWGDAPASTQDLTFIVQCLTTDGLRLTIYDYYDSTSGIKYQFDKVKISSSSGYGFNPKQVSTGTVNWSSDNVTISTF